MASKLSCKCLKHEEYSKDKKYQVFKHTAKKIKKRTYDKMMEMNIISKKDCSICTACAAFVENIKPDEIVPKKMEIEQNCFTECINKIENNSISENDITSLAESLGKRIHNSMKEDIVDYKMLYRKEGYLENMCFDTLLKFANPLFLTLINSICNIKAKSNNIKGSVVQIMELIYFLSCDEIVSPFYFAQNLLVYFLTGSRQVCDFLNKYTPSGCYKTIRNWLDDRATTELTIPDGDIMVFFDNNQILSRNWRVKYNSKYSVNVITTTIYIIPQPVNNIQMSIELSPFMWLNHSNVNIMALIYHDNKIYEQCFNKYRLSFVENIIEMLIPSFDDTLKDDIDKTNCIGNTLNFGKKQKVLLDEDNNLLYENEYDPYDPYKSVEKGNTSKPSVVVGEPIPENPCSYSSVEKFLVKLMKNKGNRQWLVVGCDGSPYILASRMIENYFICPECSETIKSKNMFVDHCKIIHQKQFDSEIHKKFKNILLLPGLGHFEINMVKAIFKLLWPVCMEDLAKMLGFRSIKALTHCQAATNHHQSWQMLQIILQGTSMELIRPYVMYCLQNKIKCTATGYFQYTKSTKDPCYLFMCISILTYVLAVHLFRCGMRRNNPEVISAAKYKASPLFYGLNMTNYQEIEYRDRVTRVLAPQPVKQFIKDNECLSVSGHESKCESGDFMLEAQNRRIKRWMPPGVPNIERWQRVCRNLDRVQKLKERMSCDLQDDIQLEIDNDCRKTDISEEIFFWRKCIRDKKYFDNPFENKLHTSLSGKQLDTELVTFSNTCRNNQNIYMQHKKQVKLKPVFILPADRNNYNDIKNKTKEEISNLIEERIDGIEINEAAEELFKEWHQDIKKSTKATMIAFYKKIT